MDAEDAAPESYDQSPMLVAFHGSGIGDQSRDLQELDELRLPTHALAHDPDMSGPTSPLVPDVSRLGTSPLLAAEDAAQQSGPAAYASNLDRRSLRSAPLTTILTTSEGLSGSNGAWTMIMSMWSASTSTSSLHSDIFESDIFKSGIRELEKGVFAAPKIPLDLKDQSAWNDLRGRLQDTIENNLRTRPGVESTISCELMMGGPDPEQLRPTVFLVCCHETYRKQLKGTLKRQRWIREFGFQLVVIVDAFEEL